jgi:hypothetical protein
MNVPTPDWTATFPREMWLAIISHIDTLGALFQLSRTNKILHTVVKALLTSHPLWDEWTPLICMNAHVFMRSAFVPRGKHSSILEYIPTLLAATGTLAAEALKSTNTRIQTQVSRETNPDLRLQLLETVLWTCGPDNSTRGVQKLKSVLTQPGIRLLEAEHATVLKEWFKLADYCAGPLKGIIRTPPKTLILRSTTRTTIGGGGRGGFWANPEDDNIQLLLEWTKHTLQTLAVSEYTMVNWFDCIPKQLKKLALLNGTHPEHSFNYLSNMDKLERFAYTGDSNSHSIIGTRLLGCLSGIASLREIDVSGCAWFSNDTLNTLIDQMKVGMFSLLQVLNIGGKKKPEAPEYNRLDLGAIVALLGASRLTSLAMDNRRFYMFSLHHADAHLDIMKTSVLEHFSAKGCGKFD